MKRLAFAVLSIPLLGAAAVAGPLPYGPSRGPSDVLDVPPAYVLQQQISGPDLHPGASHWAGGCQFVRRELPDERGYVRAFRVLTCL